LATNEQIEKLKFIFLLPQLTFSVVNQVAFKIGKDFANKHPHKKRLIVLV